MNVVGGVAVMGSQKLVCRKSKMRGSSKMAKFHAKWTNLPPTGESITGMTGGESSQLSRSWSKSLWRFASVLWDETSRKGVWSAISRTASPVATKNWTSHWRLHEGHVWQAQTVDILVLYTAEEDLPTPGDGYHVEHPGHPWMQFAKRLNREGIIPLAMLKDAPST